MRRTRHRKRRHRGQHAYRRHKLRSRHGRHSRRFKPSLRRMTQSVHVEVIVTKQGHLVCGTAASSTQTITSQAWFPIDTAITLPQLAQKTNDLLYLANVYRYFKVSAVRIVIRPQRQTVGAVGGPPEAAPSIAVPFGRENRFMCSPIVYYTRHPFYPPGMQLGDPTVAAGTDQGSSINPNIDRHVRRYELTGEHSFSFRSAIAIGVPYFRGGAWPIADANFDIADVSAANALAVRMTKCKWMPCFPLQVKDSSPSTGLDKLNTCSLLLPRFSFYFMDPLFNFWVSGTSTSVPGSGYGYLGGGR